MFTIGSDRAKTKKKILSFDIDLYLFEWELDQWDRATNISNRTESCNSIHEKLWIFRKIDKFSWRTSQAVASWSWLWNCSETPSGTWSQKRTKGRREKVAGFSVVVEVPSPTSPSTSTLLLPIGVGYELYGLPHPTVGQTLCFFLSCSRSSVGQTCSELLPLAAETGHSHQLSLTNSTVSCLFCFLPSFENKLNQNYFSNSLLLFDIDIASLVWRWSQRIRNYLFVIGREKKITEKKKRLGKNSSIVST